MTIENSEDTAQVGVTDPAEPQAHEPSSGSASVPDATAPAGAASAVLEFSLGTGAHDSTPPLSRKLAPPPKPKRDSGAASAPPSGSASARPPAPGEAPDLSASANALKAPIAPTISFSADGAPTLDSPALVASEPSAASAPNAVAPLSQPPPMRRRSHPSFPDVSAAKDVSAANASSSARTPSEPALAAGDLAAAQANATALRPIASPPRPRSDPPGPRLRSDSSPAVPDPAAARAPASSPSGFPPPSTSTSAIFAMRIIAVGDSVRPPAAQEPTPDIDPDSYPPSASRLGTTVRRSSRPVIAAATAAAAAPVALPPPAPIPTDVGPSIELDVPIDVELPPTAATASAVDVVAALDAAAAALEASSVDVPSAPARRPPAPPPPVELAHDEFSAESIAKKIAAAEAAEAAEAARVAGPVVDASRAAAPVVDATRVAAPVVDASRVAAPVVDATRVAAPVVDASRVAAPVVDASRAAAPVAAAAEPAEPAQAEELGREDAISMPPEELAADQPELDAKADPAKPPPPPKRAPGTVPSAPPAVEAAPVASSPPKDPPPAPDLAAAKAAQRSKTRAPWWEDLFNEDFMRASSRVSDEHIRREVTFIEESLGVAAGGVVLDLGCGAGHHAVEFASRGYGVVGYDLSLYQLALAADVAQERSQKINFLQGDMREMAFEEMFDGVFCWNTTFGYFEEDKNLAVAQRVFKALRPGGMFLIDVLNRDFAAASAPCTVWYEGDSCVCMDDMSVDYISSRLRVKRSIILDDGRTKESLFSLRLYSLHELGKLLHEVGFRVTEASGHPATPGVFFGPNSPRIIMLAQRP
ncbi:MAG TPA: methyltransferase domain-containing protein [Polyangiaceae bacterium]|nr:methyltransferase domain-containing protein [Polyangiaceae bacterium]